MAYLADKYNKRGIFIVIQAAICVCGLSMTAFATSHAVSSCVSFSFPLEWMMMTDGEGIGQICGSVLGDVWM
jgi:hypothetical protein